MVCGAVYTHECLLQHVLLCPEGARGAGVAEEGLSVPLEAGVADAAGVRTGAVAAEGRGVRGTGRALEGAGGCTVVLVYASDAQIPHWRTKREPRKRPSGQV